MNRPRRTTKYHSDTVCVFPVSPGRDYPRPGAGMQRNHGMEVNLFNYKRYRKTDPVSSRLAAERSAKPAETNRQILLETVRKHPGCTSVELSLLSGIERVETSRRLSDLFDDGKGPLCHGNIRKCNVKHTMMLTWNLRDDNRATDGPGEGNS